MIDGKYMKEAERLNKLPVSQEALKRLKEAKADVNQESLYLLQLVWWGLENGQELHGVKRPMLESIALNLGERNPQKAFNYLTLNEDNLPQIDEEDLKGDPEDAAQILIEQIGEKVLSNPKLNPIW